MPLATVALSGWIVAAIHAIRHLRTGDPKHDARSYVSIHISVIFGLAVLLTGAIWAKGSWGVWWEWKEPTLVSFLIVFLLYATYYPLRYAIEDRDRQARYASVFAITAGAFVPLNFLAVRLAQPLIHPRTFSSAGGLPDSMLLALPRLPGRDGPALDDPGLVRARFEGGVGQPEADPPGSGGHGVIPVLAIEGADRYVAGAYLVFLLLLLIYVAIMAAKLQPHPARARLAGGPRRAARRAAAPEHDVGQIRERGAARSRPCAREER